MRTLHRWLPILALGLSLVVTGLACSDGPGDESTLNVDQDDTNDNDDNQNNQDNDQDEDSLQLQGEMVPAAGTSLSDNFTLSGHVVPSYEPTEAESESYQLAWEPPTVTETSDDENE